MPGACPTGALIYNEFHNVYLQQDVCNGCGYCVSACPFGVLGRSEADGKAHKCTLCYDRQRDGLEPACAKSCPTDSIQFGPFAELRERARARVEECSRGERAPTSMARQLRRVQALNAFFLLTEEPAAYNLPPAPRRPSAPWVSATVERPRRGGDSGWRRDFRLGAGIATSRRLQRCCRSRPGTRAIELGSAHRRTRDAYRGVPILKQPTRNEVAAYFYPWWISAGAYAVIATLAELFGRKPFSQSRHVPR